MSRHLTRRHLTRREAAAGALALATTAALPARAQAWPSKPIRIVVPFPPGNASDLVARQLSTGLQERLGTPVVVENKTGASGTIGVGAAKAAEPDGHTVLITSLSPMVLLPATRADLPYDTLKDFVGVSMIGHTNMVLVASKQFPASNIKDAIAELKRSPGKYFYGHIGIGTISHLSMKLIIQASGADITEVPFKASSEVMTELIAGRVHLMVDGMTSALSHVRGGSTVGLAVNSATRSSLAPEIPTLREGGLPISHDVTAWTGMLAPRGTPSAIVERLNAEINTIIQRPEYKEKARIQFLETYPPNKPAEFDAYLKAELDKWVDIFKVAGVKTVR